MTGLFLRRTISRALSGMTDCPLPGIPLLTWASISKATRASNKSSPNTNDCDWRTGTSDPMRSCSSLRAPLHDDLMFREEAYRT
jgi:hypothetical protein